MKILIVDDESDIIEIVKEIILSEYQAEIITAASGNQAVQILESAIGTDIQAIISDYNMQDGNGAVVFQFNLMKNKIPFCLLTGGFVDDYKDLAGFELNSINGHYLITKPISEEEIIQTIRKMVKFKISRCS